MTPDEIRAAAERLTEAAPPLDAKTARKVASVFLAGTKPTRKAKAA